MAKLKILEGMHKGRHKKRHHGGRKKSRRHHGRK